MAKEREKETSNTGIRTQENHRNERSIQTHSADDSKASEPFRVDQMKDYREIDR